MVFPNGFLLIGSTVLCYMCISWCGSFVYNIISKYCYKDLHFIRYLFALLHFQPLEHQLSNITYHHYSDLMMVTVARKLPQRIVEAGH
jgi:hypothetical protein